MVVLVIDASSEIRARLVMMLTEVGVDAREASHAAQAYAVLKAVPVDVVVLDIRSPADDGLEVLTRIGELAPEVVSVVLTNSASEHHRRECLGRGASFFFDKSRDFDSAVRVVVERERARQRP